MRLWWALALAGCGRVGFDAIGSDAATPDGPPQPDLVQLLPAEAPHLIGYWRMEGNWTDSSARGNDLAFLSGVPTFSNVNAPVGASAGLFYDTSLVLTARPALETSYASFSVWFQSDLINTPNSNSGQMFFRMSCTTCGGDAEIDIAFEAGLDNSGAIGMTGGTNNLSLPPGTINANVWHHVVGVYAPDEQRMYIDGELAGRLPGPQTPIQSTGSILWVAQRWPNRAPLYNPQFIHGQMDDLAIWDSVLTDAEARAIYPNQKR